MNIRNITFERVSIFGKSFKPDIAQCICRVGKLLNDGSININGTLNIGDMSKVRKSDLWSYIFYLWYHNKEEGYIVFDSMSIVKYGKRRVDAEKAAATIYKYFDANEKKKFKSANPVSAIFTKKNIVAVINKIISEYKSLNIPVLKNIYDKLLTATENDTNKVFSMSRPYMQRVTTTNIKRSIENNKENPQTSILNEIVDKMLERIKSSKRTSDNTKLQSAKKVDVVTKNVIDTKLQSAKKVDVVTKNVIDTKLQSAKKDDVSKNVIDTKSQSANKLEISSIENEKQLRQEINEIEEKVRTLQNESIPYISQVKLENVKVITDSEKSKARITNSKNADVKVQFGINLSSQT